ncbi:MAG: HAMP domain-containing sensor histidine kinase [Candidatus Hydromicrobium sp.]|nr:HAMP domain-containing sensor histidine kinase [Candidatus Hydromicrobium sp.]
MEDLSLHILDIVENSIRAHAKKIEIKIIEEKKKDLLTIEIIDDGKGMDRKTLKNVLDPFFTTKNTRKVGLGLSLLAQSAEESGGSIEIESKPGQGTKVKATFGYSHIDRKPLGDVHESLKVLITANPDINFIYEYQKDDVGYRLDTKEIKK